MGRKGIQQDAEGFTVTQAQAQGNSSNGAPAAAKNDKQPGIIVLNYHNNFSGGKRRGEAGRKRGRRIKGIGKIHKKSSVQKREKKKKILREMEESVSEMRTQLNRDNYKHRLVEGEAAVEELKALIAQKREENYKQFMKNLLDQLLADEIERYIFSKYI